MENKNEFYDIKRLQKIQLDILKDIDIFCKKYNITYYITMGTLLGAIRHGGFIPWDDDIDIDMMRDDYDKFNELFLKENQEKYFLQNYLTDKQYFNINYTKIRLNNTKRVGFNMDNIDQHHGISIDVFPIDKVSENKKDRFRQRRKIRILTYLAVAKAGYTSTKTKKRDKLFLKLIHILLTPFSMYSLGKILEKIKTEQNNTNTDLVARTHYIKGGETVVFNKEIYGKPAQLYFEKTRFPAPNQYIKFLEQVYGDYLQLPPANKRFNYNHVVKYVDFGEYGKDEKK
ncbi:LicD family protein [[Clostridium] innocuum]|nr:LicD family protein [[Clostridium] innocuum]